MTIHKRWTSLQNFVNQVNKQLIVSCQALPDEPLYGPEIMSKMAIAAAAGGAKAIRANTPHDVYSIKQSVNTRVTGLNLTFPFWSSVETILVLWESGPGYYKA